MAWRPNTRKKIELAKCLQDLIVRKGWVNNYGYSKERTKGKLKHD